MPDKAQKSRSTSYTDRSVAGNPSKTMSRLPGVTALSKKDNIQSTTTDANLSFNDRVPMQLKRFHTNQKIGDINKGHIEIKEFDEDDTGRGTVAFIVPEANGPAYIADNATTGRHAALYRTVKSTIGFVDPNPPSVEYAGVIKYAAFGGNFVRWTNDSGHFIPETAFAQQAGIAMDKYVPYESYAANGFNDPSLANAQDDDKPVFTPGNTVVIEQPKI